MTSSIRRDVYRYTAETIAYRDRILLAGSNISSSSLRAVDVFVRGLQAEGLWDKMVEIGPFMGTSLAGAMVKLKYASASAITNHGFLSGDFTPAGLQGNGSTKYLDPTLILSSHVGTDGLFLAVMNKSDDGLGGALLQMIGDDDTRIAYNEPTGAEVSFTWRGIFSASTPAVAIGLYVGQLTDQGEKAALYLDGELLGESGTVTTTEQGESQTYLFAGNDGSDSPQDYYDGVLSFYAAGLPLTDSEIGAFSRLVAALDSSRS